MDKYNWSFDGEYKTVFIGESVLGGIKSFFGINSPSKVMAAEVGKWLPARPGIQHRDAERTAGRWL